MIENAICVPCFATLECGLKKYLDLNGKILLIPEFQSKGLSSILREINQKLSPRKQKQVSALFPCQTVYAHIYLMPRSLDLSLDTKIMILRFLIPKLKDHLKKIRKIFGLGGYSAHDFRDTCATEWREAGMNLDLIARMLGHSKTETTEQRYVKYRDTMMDEAKMYIDSNAIFVI